MIRYLSLSLLLLSFLFLLVSCLKEPGKDNVSSEIPIEHTESRWISFAIPDTEYVDTPSREMKRLQYGIDLLKLLKNREDASIVESTITAMQQALNREEVSSDTELYIDLNYWLGVLYAGKKENEKAIEYFRKVEEAAQRDEKHYRKYLESIYRRGANINVALKRYGEAIRMRKKLIEEFQGIGHGIRKNEVAAMSVLQLVFLSRLAPAEAENITNYLVKLTKRYRGSEVGLAAVASLYDISKRAGDEQRAVEYLIQMQAYPSTPEFRRYSEPMLKKWERIEAIKRKAEQ